MGVQWKQSMRDGNIRLPAKDDLSEAYLNASRLHKNFKYDKLQIAKMRAKKSLNYDAKNLANPHKEKLRIGTWLNGMGDDDDDVDMTEKKRLQTYLNDIDREIDRRRSEGSHAVKISIASINEKNKIKNKKLMLSAREKERRLRIANKGKKAVSDPFTRAITAPKIESFNSMPFDDKEESVDKKLKEEEDKEKNVKRKSKHEEHMEALQKLSILEEHEKRMKVKTEGPLDGDESVDVSGKYKDGLLIRGDELWKTAIHDVARQFVDKCKVIEMESGFDRISTDAMMRQPQFGRNTNKSKYGHKFMKRPSDLQIISIDEYLKTKKYSAM